MFDWFLKEYETNIYKANDRKLRTLYTWEKVLLISLIAFSIGFAFITIYQPQSPLEIIFLFVSIGLLIACYYLEENRRKKEIDIIIERFKKNKMEPFINMLRSERYTLFGRTLDNKEGIEWLLNACSNEIERCKNKPSFVIPKRSLFFTLILPIGTYVVGTFASTLSPSERFYFSAMVLVILLLLFAIYCIVAPTLNDFLTKRIKVIEDLRDNLEYYKIAK